MKKIISLAVFLFMVSLSNLWAQIYLIYKNDDNSIYSMSDMDDAVMPKEGYTKIILKGGFENYPLDHEFIYYKYRDKKFILNTQKISDEENIKEEAIEKSNEEKLIQERIRKTTYEELIKEGKKFKYIKY